MGYFVSLICLLFVILGIYKEKNIYNPITAYNALFFILAISSSIRLFGLNDVSRSTWYIVLFGTLFYNIGALAANKSIKPHCKENRKDYNFRYKFIYVLSFITLVYLLWNTIDVVKYLFDGKTLRDIRIMYYSTESDYFGGPLKYTYRTYINRPIIHLIVPLTIIDYFKGNRDRKLLILTILNILLYTFTNGGRLIFIYIGIHIITAILIYKKEFNFSKSSIIKLIIAGVILISCIGVISSLRIVNRPSKYAYTYIAGTIPHLDYRINVIKENNEFTYGISTSYGVIQPLLFVLKNIRLIDYPEFYIRSIQLAKVQDYIDVGTNQKFNSFVTPYFYFFLDFGFYGVITLAFIYGFASMTIYSMHKESIRHTLIYLLLLQGLLTSMIRFQFVVSSVVIAFIMVFFVTKPITDRKNGVQNE